MSLEPTIDWYLTGHVVASTALQAGIAFFFLWFFYMMKLDRNKRLIDKIPGYKDWPIVGDILHLPRDPVKLYPLIVQSCFQNRKYGIQKMRTGIWFIVRIFTPKEIEKLLRSSTLIEKSDYYDFMKPWLGLGLLTSGGSKWKSRRRMLTPSFHFNILKDYIISMNKHVSTLREKLQSEVCDGEAFDIFPYITLNALDLICDTAMGVDMNALGDGESEYVKAVYVVKEAIAIRQRTPWYWPDWLYNRLPIGQATNRGIDVMHRYARKVIKERRETKEEFEQSRKHKAFIDILLDSKDEFGNSLTDEDIREEVDTFMFEGHDTVSAAIAHAIHLLGANTECQRQCQAELDEIMESPRDFTVDDLSKMYYLEWCIKEALRLYPSVPWFARELPEDTEFAGYLVPKKTSMVVMVAALHHDPDIYPDPERFDPTRFSPDNSAKRHPYAFIPFSAGPRNCIGQRFAMMELKIILASILLHFNIESTQKREEVKPNPGLVLQPSTGIWVKLTSRQ